MHRLVGWLIHRITSSVFGRAARPAHSPLVTFFWGHVGWLLVGIPSTARPFPPTTAMLVICCVTRSTCDWSARGGWLWVNLVQWFVFVGVGALIGCAFLVGQASPVCNSDFSLLVWEALFAPWRFGTLPGVLIPSRTCGGTGIMKLMKTAAIIGWLDWSATAKAGTTTITPISNAAHGHRWWEFDVTYITIWLLEKFGLATNVLRPSSKLTKGRN